jgi:hypothetical protein
VIAISQDITLLDQVLHVNPPLQVRRMVKETRNGLQYRLDANTGVAGPSLC